MYGFRIAIAFSGLLLTFNYVAGIIIGCAMGYFGGAFDLLFQRVIEIWSNIPFLYVIMIVASVVVPSFLTLVIVMAALGWMQLTWNMRTSTYKEKSREYVSAARALGAGNVRIVGSHILPNTIAVIVTFVPFSIASGVTFLTALDYLGFGLPAANTKLGRAALARHQSTSGAVDCHVCGGGDGGRVAYGPRMWAKQFAKPSIQNNLPTTNNRQP